MPVVFLFVLSLYEYIDLRLKGSLSIFSVQGLHESIMFWDSLLSCLACVLLMRANLCDKLPIEIIYALLLG